MTQFVRTFGTRLTAEDGTKLTSLCEATRRPPSEVIRLLIRLAEPTDLAPITFGQTPAGTQRGS